MLSVETRQKKLVSSRAWKARNKERANELSRQWYNNNRELCIARAAVYKKDHREEYNALQRDYNKRHYGRDYEAKKLRRYGLKPEEFHHMLQSQSGLCHICGTVLDSHDREATPHVDHDHATGRVRGLLCGNCNRGLGCFKDAVSSLIAAAHYIG